MRSAPALAPALALVLAVCAAGCSSLPEGVDTYLRSRGADLADTVPMSVAFGRGASVSVRATALLDVGLGLIPVQDWRWGYDDRTFHGVWSEYQSTFPWTFWLSDDLPATPATWGVFEAGLPVVYRWQAKRDAPPAEGTRTRSYEPLTKQQWGRHPSVTRETTGALLVPEVRRWIRWEDMSREDVRSPPLDSVRAPERASVWQASRDGPRAETDWTGFEADVFVLFLGIRVGVRPLEGVDFLVGLVGLDLMQDDLPAPKTYALQPWPPGADAIQTTPPVPTPDDPHPMAAKPPPPAGADDEAPVDPGAGQPGSRPSTAGSRSRRCPARSLRHRSGN